MRRIVSAAAILGLGLLGACNVNVDDKTEAAAENSAESLGNSIESIAEDAGNTLESTAGVVGNELEKAGDAIDDQAGDLRNGVDVDIKVGDGKADANSH